MENLFSGLKTAEIFDFLCEFFPGGIRYTDVTLTFSGRSVVITQNGVQRIGYKKWRKPCVNRIPLKSVIAEDIKGGGIRFRFTANHEFIVEG